MNDQRRNQRKEIQALSSESAWLQKALFALGKAEDAREAYSDLKRREPAPFELELDGKTLSVDDFQEGLEKRIQELLQDIRERRKILR